MAEQMSLVNRRNILLGLAGGAVAAGGIAVQQTGGAGTFAELLRPTGLGRRGAFLATATKDDWALQVGTFFTAHTGHVLKLVDVQAFPQHGARPSGLRPRAFISRFQITSGGATLNSRAMVGSATLAIAESSTAIVIASPIASMDQ